jgi:CIC family chloride channel protein
MPQGIPGFLIKILSLAPVKLLYQTITSLLRTKLSRMQFIMVIATLVGFSSGMVAVLLKTLVHFVRHWIEQIPVWRFSYLLFPTIGLIITVFIVQYFFAGQFEKGIAMVLKAIARKSSFIPLRHTYQHIITSSITVGLGGSVGLEAPIVATGSAVGSNLAA